ncbi:UvrD-helicase domain-containing protein [Acinetobacter sp.]|uniref:UvrD-helicase domain-containing protein n=1 Tax=Acinetobacter sp. TaxID=472 RepID=UPI0031D3991F
MTAAVSLSYHPITDIHFEGLHWIEASAGSGKTYTLSSLMVRILLEKYLPRQVIATTFTRAAAAELKGRIRSRLVETYRFFDARRKATQQENQQYAQQLKDQDPLQAKVLETYAGQVAYACSRLKLVIDQLDELFVGTLDSFSQKLLREFAFESGRIERSDITDNAKQYTRQLIHDVLREWIQAQPQTSIDWMYASGELEPVENYIDVVESSLNFGNAHLEAVEPQALQLDELLQQRTQITTLDLNHLTAFYLPTGEYFKGVSGTYFKKDSFTVLFCDIIPCAVTLILNDNGQAFFGKNFAGQRAKLFKFLELFEQQKIFSKKCPADAAEQFYQDTQLKALLAVLQHLLTMQQTLADMGTFLKFYLCQQVKTRLPQQLQQAGETTFSQQIRTLSEALQGTQGQHFSAFVHQTYPLILVDEFQDTNQDQDNMLASIWRHPKRYARGCMIMVGDRKQAIYGFRGGDMLTFIQAYQDVIQKSGQFYQLQYNHRSVAPLVEVVDALFQKQPDFGEQVIYHPVFAGTRPHPALVDQSQQNPLPLRWFHIEDKSEHPQQVAWKIRTLLNQSALGQLYFATEPTPQALVEDDIAVLSKNHDGLDKVQFALEHMGIRVNRPAKRSVFDHVIAKDIGAVLTAILNPYDETKLRRALLSRLFNFNLRQLLQLQAQPQGFSDYIDAFNHVRELWFERNFLSAWQYCLQRFDVWQTLVATPSQDNERVVVNVRHLTELLSEHSRYHAGPQHLYQWYFKQLNSPSKREWELERQLSNATGVKLMTIHQSKGLEFKVVFLLNADGSFKEQNKSLNFSMVEQLNPITAQPERKRVIAIHHQHLSAAQIEQHEQRAEAEQHRLWYVALTRASHRVYAVVSSTKVIMNGLGFWKNQQPEFSHPYSGIEPVLTSRPHIEKQVVEVQQSTPLIAKPLPEKRFYPSSRTSFTGLAQHLTRAQMQDMLASLPEVTLAAADEVVSVTIPQTTQGQKLTWVRQAFPQGTQAGTFLHTILENLDFQDQTLWAQELHRRFKNADQGLWQQLQERYAQEYALQNLETTHTDHVMALLQQWLDEILHTPLHPNLTLAQLQPNQYLAEFPFFMALSDRVFATQRIQALFLEYGYHMPNLNHAESARFLNGAIDLVYQHDGQFYIADYKSNHLGMMFEDYTETALKQNMSMSSYWLQAAIYLVALHRYLKVRLKNYSIEQHLGGASYLYLRGMQPDASYGVVHWKPELELILRLDAILGYPPRENG